MNTAIAFAIQAVNFICPNILPIRNVVSTWSSGTGGSGIIGAVSYAGLISFGVSPVNTMLIMLSVPALEAIAFWLILRKPTAETITLGIENTQFEGQSTDTIAVDNIRATDIEMSNKLSGNDSDDESSFGIKEKFMYLPSLFKYIIPITLVYFLEYFINQGLVRLHCYMNGSSSCLRIFILIYKFSSLNWSTFPTYGWTKSRSTDGFRSTTNWASLYPDRP